MRFFSKIGCLVTLLACFAFYNGSKKTKVVLVGDSTMSVKDVKAYPEAGWGMPFALFFDSTVVVENVAQNGRSTKSFIEEKRWQKVMENLAEGDYVLIQFGHNDEVKEKVGRYTTPDEYKANLTRFVNDVRSKKAYPILITPVARRKFDSTGIQIDTHKEYAPLVKQVAEAVQAPLIDLNAKSLALLQELGPDKSLFFFNHLAPGEHPNHPNGKQDDTHFSEFGARKMAQLVLSEIRAQHMPLENKIVGNKGR
jgi:lysophospholipase L1-like esterase